MKTLETELHKFNFPRILINLHRNRRTGTLVVNSGDVTKRVYIENGNAVFASSTDEDDRLGEMLIKLGKITYEQYERSVELLKETGKRQGTILVELGFLSPKDLVMGVKAQVREIIYSLFQLEYAEYVFEEGTIPTREVITLQMSIGNLIYEGMKRINNVVRIRRDMPNMNAILKVNEEQNSFCQDIVLTPGDSAMLAMVDGKKTVKELIDSTSGSTFEAMKTLYILYVSGFVTEEGRSDDVVGVTESDHRVEKVEEANDVAFREQVNALFSRLHDIQAHEILSIDEHSDSETVERQYYKLIAEYHPDRGIAAGDPLMQDKLIAITEHIQNAFIALRDDDKRRRYFEAIGNRDDASLHMSSGEDEMMSELHKINEDMRMMREEPQEPKSLDLEQNDYLNGLPFREPEPSTNFYSEERYDGFAQKHDGDSIVHREHETEPFETDPLKWQADDESSASGQGMFWEAESGEDQTASSEPSEMQFRSAADFAVQDKTESMIERLPEINVIDEASDSGTGRSSDTEERAATTEEQARNGIPTETIERRRYRRYKVDGCDVVGELLHARTVTIVNLSVSGIALKVDRQLRVGGKYSLTLRDKDRNIRLSAEVVRSNLVESKIDSEGNAIPQYLVGMEFKDLSPDAMQEITAFLHRHKVEDAAVNRGCTLSGTRVHGRYAIESVDETSLDLKGYCRVKVLSMCGMLIESTQAVQPNDMVSLTLSLPEGRTVSLTGKTISLKPSESNPEYYDIAIEFVELSEKDSESLKIFLESVSELEENKSACLETTPTVQKIADESHFDGNGSGQDAVEEVHPVPDEELNRSEQETFNRQLLALVGEIKVVLEQIRDEFHRHASLPVRETEGFEKTMEHAVTTQMSSLLRNEALPLPEEIERGREESEEAEPMTVQHENSEAKLADRSQQHHREGEKAESVSSRRQKKTFRKAYVWISLLFLMAGIATFVLIYTPGKSGMPSKVQVEKVSPVSVQKTASQQMTKPVTEKKEPVALPTPSVHHTLELRASDTTWLSVALDGKTSKEMILKPGDKTQFSAKTVSLVIGNAGGVKVVFDGKEIPLPAEKGKVVKLSLPRGNS